MSLPKPAYIVDSVSNRDIRYSWDDWNVEQAQQPLDAELLERLKRVSPRAIIAFVTATAEWIIWRYERLCDDPLPIQFVESAWAMIVDFRYCRVVWEDFTEPTDWRGPVRGPLGVAMTRLHYTIERTLEGQGFELRAVWISSLALHVLTDPQPYRTWRTVIIERMEKLYPRMPGDKLGDVVPREALDPIINFDTTTTEASINRFLAVLNPPANHFLNTPERMLEEGFEGKPYVFDMEQDRKARHRI